MEWADEQVHMPGGKIEGWNEGKVREALNNYYRGRQKREDLRILAFYLEVICALVFARCSGQNVAHYAAAWHHLDWEDTGRQVFGFQDHSICAVPL